MSEQIYEVIENFIESCKEPFNIDDLIQDLSEIMPEKRSISYQALCRMLELDFPVFEASDDVWVPSHIFFKNAKFLIRPGAREIQDGILVPGHRCIPFHNPSILPWEITFKDEEKKAVPFKQWTAYTIDDSTIFYSLHGLENLVFLLMNDSESNQEALTSTDDGDVFISQRVCSMKHFYEKHGFQDGDFIECTCRDYEKAIYDIRYLPASEAARRNTENWIEKLDDCFDTVFTYSNGLKAIWKQMGEAFFHAGKAFHKKPALHFGGYIDRSKNTGICMSVDKGVLWYKDEEYDPRDIAEFDGPEFIGECYSLDAIFQDIGISFTEKQVVAYVRDELFQKHTSPERVIERCFDGRKMKFATDQQEEAFYEYINQLWEKISAGYNIFADQERGKIRRRILEMLDKMNRYFRELDARGVDPSDIPFDVLQSGGQISGQLEQYLELLESDEITPKLVQESNRILDQVDPVIDHILERMEGSVR